MAHEADVDRCDRLRRRVHRVHRHVSLPDVRGEVVGERPARRVRLDVPVRAFEEAGEQARARQERRHVRTAHAVSRQEQVGGEQRAGERVLDPRFELEPHVERPAARHERDRGIDAWPCRARVVAHRQRRRQRRPAEREAVLARAVERASARGLTGRLLRRPQASDLSSQHSLAAAPVEELEDLAVLLAEDEAVARRGQHEHARILRREPDRRLCEPRLRLRLWLGLRLAVEPARCRAHAEQACRNERYSREPPLHGVEATGYERTARDCRWTTIFRFTRWSALSIVFVSHPRSSAICSYELPSR